MKINLIFSKEFLAFLEAKILSVETVTKTRPDTQPIPVADGWAGAEMRVFALSQLDHHGPTDRPTKQPTDGQSLLQSR